MEKYIRTFHEDEKVILKLNGCQVCPLMKFNMNLDTCTCRYFSSKNKQNVVDPFVINSTINGIVNDEIKIPTWCGLPNNLFELSKYRTTFRAFKSSILAEANDNCDDDLLPFLDAEKLKLEGDKKLDNFLIQLVDNKVNFDFNSDDTISPEGICQRHHPDFTSIVKHQNNYPYQTPIKKQEICSLCGEDDKSVKRNEHLGMCDDCWVLSYNDEDKKKQAYINNFRMKRNKEFPKETFKILTNIQV
jgi:hypothetical protein